MKEKNLIKERSWKFVLSIVYLYKFLNQLKRKFVFFKEILNSDTSIGTNIEYSNQKEILFQRSVLHVKKKEIHYI